MALKSASEFASAIRSSYPGQYDMMDDEELSVSYAKSYPDTREYIDWGSFSPDGRRIAAQHLEKDPIVLGRMGAFGSPVKAPAPVSAVRAPVAVQSAIPTTSTMTMDDVRGRIDEQDAQREESVANQNTVNELQSMQDDWRRRRDAGQLPKVARPLFGGVLGDGVTALQYEEPYPTEADFVEGKSGVQMGKFQKGLLNASNLMRDAVAPVTNLFTDRGGMFDYNSADRKGRMLNQEIGNFKHRELLATAQKKKESGVALTPDEGMALQDADAGTFEQVAGFFDGMINDPQMRNDVVEIMASEVPVNVIMAPFIEGGIVRAYGAVKNVMRAYKVRKAEQKLAALESAGRLAPGERAAHIERFKSVDASRAARTSMADDLAPGDSRALKDVLDKVGVPMGARARQFIAGTGKEAVSEMVSEVPLETAFGYGRGENDFSLDAMGENALQEGLMTGPIGVAVGAGKMATGRTHGLSIENADAAVSKLDTRPWIQAETAPQGVTRPTVGNERAGRSSVPGVESARNHPEFHGFMAKIAEAAKNPELAGQNFRIQSADITAELGANDLGAVGYDADLAGGQSIRGYSVPGTEGRSTAVVNRSGDGSTLAHETIHGIERQSARDPELSDMNDMIEGWKHQASVWATEQGFDVPADPKELRRYQSELFTRAMNYRLGGKEDAVAEVVPMPAALVWSFDAHAGAIIRNGDMRLDNGEFGQAASAEPYPLNYDMSEVPFSMTKDPNQASMFDAQQSDALVNVDGLKSPELLALEAKRTKLVDLLSSAKAGRVNVSRAHELIADLDRQIQEFGGKNKPKGGSPVSGASKPLQGGNIHAGQSSLFGEGGDLFAKADGRALEQEVEPATPNVAPLPEATPVDVSPSVGIPSGKLDDFGEKIGGARKDQWRDRSLDRADLDEMNDREAQKYVKRDVVWKEPDWSAVSSALETSGVDRNIAVKSAWLQREIRRAVGNPDPAATKEGMAAYLSGVDLVREFAAGVRTERDLSGAMVKIFGNDIVDGRYITTKATKYKEFAALGARFLSAIQGIQRKASRDMQKDLEKGWPGEIEDWKKKFEVKTWDSPVKEGDWFGPKKREYQIVSFRRENGRFIRSQHFANEADAVAWAKGESAKVRPSTKTVQPSGTGSAGTVRASRTGGENWRNGRDVDGNDLLQAFGFRGGEFGKWANQAERQASVNFAYDSLMDLAQVLGIPPRAISLNGELAIAFGARGSGAAAAHYEPAKIVINLTKTSGAGSLAHEWAHAVDDYFSRQAGMKAVGGESYVSHGVPANSGMREEMANAWRNVVRTIWTGADGKRTKYVQAAADKGQYWVRRHELFARAFDAYVTERLDDSGVSNTYLSKTLDRQDTDDTFPQGAERVAINQSLDELAQTIKTKDGENGNVIMYSMAKPTTWDEIEKGQKLNTVKKLLKKKGSTESPKRLIGAPEKLDESNFEKGITSVLKMLVATKSVDAVDGRVVKMDYPEKSSRGEHPLRARARHLIGEDENGHRNPDDSKMKWVGAIKNTLEDADIIAEGMHDGRAKVYYLKSYKNGTHLVITEKDGGLIDQGAAEGLVSQFEKNLNSGFDNSFVVKWVKKESPREEAFNSSLSPSTTVASEYPAGGFRNMDQTEDTRFHAHRSSDEARTHNLSNSEKNVNDSESSNSDISLSLKPKNEEQGAQASLIRIALHALRKQGIFMAAEDLSSQWGKMPKKARVDEEMSKRHKSKWDKALEELDLAIREEPMLAIMAGIRGYEVDATNTTGADVNDVIWKLSDWANQMGKGGLNEGHKGVELRAMRNPDSLPFEWPKEDRRQVTIGYLMDGKLRGYISVLQNPKLFVRWDEKSHEWVVRDGDKNESRMGGYDKVWVDVDSDAVDEGAVHSKPTRQESSSTSTWEPSLDWASPVPPDIRDMQPSKERSEKARQIFDGVPEHLKADFDSYATARDALYFNDFAKDQSSLEKMAPDAREKQMNLDLAKVTKADALSTVAKIERRYDFQAEFQPRYQELLELRKKDVKNSVPEKTDESSVPAELSKSGGVTLKGEKTGGQLTDETFFTQALTRDGDGVWLTKKERAYAAMVDEAYPIEKVQKLYDKAHGVTEFAESIGAKIDQVRGAAGVAKAHAEATLDPIYAGGNMVVWEDGKQKSIKLAKLSAPEQLALDRYLVAKTALWRYENNGMTDGSEKDSGRFRFSDTFLTEERCKSWIKGIEGRADFKELERRAKLMWQFHRNLSLMKLDAGHWTPEMYAQITQDPFYVPLIRDVKSAYGNKSPMPGKGQGRYTSTDDLVRGQYVLDRQVQYIRPYVASRMDQEATFGETAKARVARAVVALAKKDGGLAQLVQKLEEGEDPGQGASVVPVLEDGRVVQYKVEAELANYIQGMGAYVPQNALLKAVISANNLWKGMTTSWNPDFSVANTFRDVQESTLNTTMGGPKGLLQYFANDLRVGFWQAVTKGEIYQKYRLGGGMMDSFDVKGGHGASVDDVMYGGLWEKVKDPANYAAEENPKLARMLDRLRAAGRSTTDFLGAIGEVSEMTTRLAMYQTVKRNGGSDAEAIRGARQGTLDFQRHGTMGKNFNAFIPFFNAAIQGTDKTVRTLTATDKAGMGKERAKAVARRMTKVVAFGALPTVALVMWNSDHEEYGNIPVSERENNWIFMLEGKNYIKVPKSAWQKLTQNTLQATMEQILGVTTAEASPVWQTAVRSLAGTLPVGDVIGVPLVKTIIEEQMNKSLYFRSPIWNENVEPWMQISPWTSETMKKIGWALGMSPARMEHVLQGALGGNTQNIFFLTDLALSARDDVSLPKMKRVPFVKRLYGQAQEWGGDFERAERENLKAIRGTMKDGKRELKLLYRREIDKAKEMESSGDALGAKQVRLLAQEYLLAHNERLQVLVQRRKDLLAARGVLDTLQEKLLAEGAE